MAVVSSVDLKRQRSKRWRNSTPVNEITRQPRRPRLAGRNRGVKSHQPLGLGIARVANRFGVRIFECAGSGACGCEPNFGGRSNDAPDPRLSHRSERNVETSPRFDSGAGRARHWRISPLDSELHAPIACRSEYVEKGLVARDQSNLGKQSRTSKAHSI